MRYLLVLLGLLVTSTAQAVDCQSVPSCTELGYTKEPDPNCKSDGYIFCPFDKSYKKCVNYNCESLGFTNTDKSSWCKNIATCRIDNQYTLCVKATCEIGDVFYADGSCGLVDDYDGSKTPVGVVFYTSDGGYHGKVVNLMTPNEEEQIGNVQDVSSIKAYSFNALKTALQNNEKEVFDGKANTKILWESQMALFAQEYYPSNVDSSDAVSGKGQWYLPSIGELLLLYNPDASQLVSEAKMDNQIPGLSLKTVPVIREQVDSTLEALQNKGVGVSLLSAHKNYNWSSSRYAGDGNCAFFAMSLPHGHIGKDGTPTDKKPIRLMLEF